MSEGGDGQSSLRAYVYIDKAQPQYAALISKSMKGHAPEAGMAQLYLEFDDTVEVVQAMDTALKAAHVHAGFLEVVRSPGKMEVHSASQTDVWQAGEAIQEKHGPEASQTKPVILGSHLITNVDDQLGTLLSGFSGHAPVAARQSVLALEVAPSCFAALACNEAEKHANVHIVGVRWSGRTGFVYVSGSEEEAKVARDVIFERFSKVPGRERQKR